MNLFQSLVRRLSKRQSPTGTIRKNRSLLNVEAMENRLVPATIGMTKWAAVDFDGESISSSEMSSYYSAGTPAQNLSSFRSLFTDARPRLDMNGDGRVNGTDADLAQGAVMRKVQQDFAPYDVSVFAGEEDDWKYILSDGVVGDAIAVVTGSADTLSTQGAWGWAPYDPGNVGDQYAFVFAGGSVDSFSSRDQWLNQVARTISHELGHTFGLDHEVGDTSGQADPISHSVMASGDLRDFTRDFSFQDRTYTTEGGASQNAHSYLSRADVLGESNNVWMQVLTPGTLTISGNSGANVMRLLPRTATSWEVVVDGVSTIVDLTSRDTQSLNPFDAPLTNVRILGKDGNDNIAIDYRLAVPSAIYGGNGDDSIWGGQGVDVIFGGNGNDRIDGYLGHDWIQGDAGNDVLIGHSGDDILLGGSGRDSLYGGDGNDYLNGGQDGEQDVLWGQGGRDTFVADWFHGVNLDFPFDSNPGEGDRVV